MEQAKINDALKILATGVVDYVLLKNDTQGEIQTVLKRASERAVLIMDSSIIPRPHNLRFSHEQSYIARSLLRIHDKSYIRMNLPGLHGIFIIRNNLPFYHSLWSESNAPVSVNSESFTNFINSLSVFSDEMFLSPEVISGVRFGEASLIIQNMFEFSFIFFTSGIDESNFYITYKHINTSVLALYDLMSIANIREAWGPELHAQIEQIIVELFLKFSSMSVE